MKIKIISFLKFEKTNTVLFLKYIYKKATYKYPNYICFYVQA